MLGTARSGDVVGLDVLIFGGGAAGLWTLDVLAARGVRALLVETAALGAGQTIASQGIIHGGLKYTLQGLLTKSAANIREMPRVWAECLAGERVPNLSSVRMRAPACHLWRTDALSSRLGMLGASVGLQVTPDLLPENARPAVLAGCPGTVARLAEPVISPTSFLETLAKRHATRLLKVDADGIAFQTTAAGDVQQVELRNGTRSVTLAPRLVVFAAGAGNQQLLSAIGRSVPPMQRRPLHMVMVRGDLPELNGHCVDGAKTRVTITSERTADGDMVWQLGGHLAEQGVALDRGALIAHAQRELAAVLPSFAMHGLRWTTYRVDRAEGATGGGLRPDDIQLVHQGNVLTAWPTKLALVPELARAVVARVVPSDESTVFPGPYLLDWPTPNVAAPPWETAVWSGQDRVAAAA